MLIDIESPVERFYCRAKIGRLRRYINRCFLFFLIQSRVSQQKSKEERKKKRKSSDLRLNEISVAFLAAAFKM